MQKMEEVIFNNKGGMGLILNGNHNIDDFVYKKPIKIIDTIIQPEQFTTLFGIFDSPVRYVGCQKDKESKIMVFHTGDDSSLFETSKYYYCFGWLNQFRIFNCYTYGTARDFNWDGKKWK